MKKVFSNLVNYDYNRNIDLKWSVKPIINEIPELILLLIIIEFYEPVCQIKTSEKIA